jgi:transcriptional regulator with XRE-family HTH domain
MERWRASRGVSHAEFAAGLGRSQSEWSHVLRGRRPVPRSMAAAVLATADEPWRSGFERALVDDLAEAGSGGRAAGAQHATPEG